MRRLFDIVLSLVVLILIWPLLVLIAVAIRIDSPGNPLYRGWRVGKDGVPFRMWKFRTMTVDADRIGEGITAGQDPRVTRLGWYLRKTKLDELPQFVNALLGEMSIIGPRAEVPSIVTRYTSQQREILQYKPGITGVGAIHYTVTQNRTLPPDSSAEEYYVSKLLSEKLQMEIEYERHRTIASDLGIVISTVWLILQCILPPISSRR